MHATRINNVTKTLLVAITAFVISACSPITLVNGLSPSSHYQLATNIAYDTGQRRTLDVYVPRSANSDSPVVVFFYGGGWEDGKKKDYEFVASSLTKAGYLVVIPDYRLHPEVSFPSFVEDSAKAVAWTIDNVSIYGGDTDRLFVVGHSAGAHIAAMLVTDPQFLVQHDIGIDQISGFVGLSGPYDFLPIGPSYLEQVFPEANREDSQPINFVSANMPPTLLIHGTGDDTVESGNSQRLADRMSDAGVDVALKLYDGVGHAAVAAALSPPLNFANNTLEDSLAFLDALSQQQE